MGCLACGIALAWLHPFTPTQVVVALVVTAAARFLIPFFATGQHGSRVQTAHGIIHMVLAVIAVVLAIRDPRTTVIEGGPQCLP